MEPVKRSRKYSKAGFFSRTAGGVGPVHRVRQPAILRNLLPRLVIALCLTMILGVALTITLARSGMYKPGIEISSYLFPGNPLPASASCRIGEPGYRYLLYCKVYQDGGALISFTYDRRIQAIRTASLAVTGVTLGDLILAWGTPDRCKSDSRTIQIDWGKKTAWLSAPLDPTAPVNLILYYLDDSDLPPVWLPWQGFATVDTSRGCSAHAT